MMIHVTKMKPKTMKPKLLVQPKVSPKFLVHQLTSPPLRMINNNSNNNNNMLIMLPHHLPSIVVVPNSSNYHLFLLLLLLLMTNFYYKNVLIVNNKIIKGVTSSIVSRIQSEHDEIQRVEQQRRSFRELEKDVLELLDLEEEMRKSIEDC